MTLKYLRMMGVEFGENERQMHIPIDNYIIEAAKEPEEKELMEGSGVYGLGIKNPFKLSWSRCDDHEVYRRFQKEVIQKLTVNN